MNLVFIVTLFILFFMTLQGWRRGLLSIIYRMLAWVFVLVFVAVAHPYIQEYLIQNTSIYDKICNQASLYIEEKAQSIPADTGLQEWYDTMMQGVPENISAGFLSDIEQTIPIEGGLQGLLENNDISMDTLGGYENLLNLSDGSQTLQQRLAAYIADFVIQGIAVLLAFVIAEIAVLIVGILVKGLGRAPVIRQVNGLFGLLAGAVEGFLIVWILMFLAACLGSTSFGQTVIAEIYQNAFLVFLYEHNLITALVSL